MKQILTPFVRDRCPDIPSVAEMLGTSPRSLQRKLTEAGTSYSRIVQELRYTAATGMLLDQSIRMIDVAFSLGYDDPAHFTRFFRRIAGITPRSYRRLLREGTFDRQAAG